MFAQRKSQTAPYGAVPYALKAGGIERTCVVRLIDRRTGLTHRVNGTPLVVFTRSPQQAVAELLAGRDNSIWEARIDPIEG